MSPQAGHRHHRMPRRPRQHLDDDPGLRRSEHLAPACPAPPGRDGVHEDRSSLHSQPGTQPLRQRDTPVRQPHRERPGCAAARVKPTTSTSVVSACRTFFRDDDRPARYGALPSFAITPSTPEATSVSYRTRATSTSSAADTA